MAFLDVYSHLLDVLRLKSKENSAFRFRPRKTNRNNKLVEGYWFLGNDSYLSIGFWIGMNWKRKTPNIGFFCDNAGAKWLGINVSDSLDKRRFVEKYLIKNITELRKQNDDSYFKMYGGDYVEALIEFLNEDWKIIQNAIIRYEFDNDHTHKYPTLFHRITYDEFDTDMLRLEAYELEKRQLDEDLKWLKPSKLTGFTIRNYHPIKTTEVLNIPKDNQWIFFTGENGVGKTTVLKALATSLAHRRLNNSELDQDGEFNVKLIMSGNKAKEIKFERKGNKGSKRQKPYSLGFTAYGPMRLQPIHGGMTKKQLKEAKGKSGSFASLFSTNSYLLDMEEEIAEWTKKDVQKLRQRIIPYGEFLEEAMLNIGKVRFEYDVNGIPTTLFQEIDSDGELMEPITIDQLSSGYISIVSMMNDMLIRLFRQQPDKVDPGDLKGIVIIDEIDIHLHPKFQKHFVEQLTQAFPNVQFIVSTHSPIPLLGAPSNSVFIRVRRDVSDGVVLDRLDDKLHIEDLLPNAILSSPIFGLEDLTSSAKPENVPTQTESDFSALEQTRAVRNKITDFLNNAKETELIQLFEKRRNEQ